jgi:hypothetical protein
MDRNNKFHNLEGWINIYGPINNLPYGELPISSLPISVPQAKTLAVAGL